MAAAATLVRPTRTTSSSCLTVARLRRFTGWSVQYASATGTTGRGQICQEWTRAGSVLPRSGSAGDRRHTSLPTPHATGDHPTAPAARSRSCCQTPTSSTTAAAALRTRRDGDGIGDGTSPRDMRGHGPVSSDQRPTIRNERWRQDTDNNNVDFSVGDARTPSNRRSNSINAHRVRTSRRPARHGTDRLEHHGHLQRAVAVAGAWYSITCTRQRRDTRRL